MGAIALAGALLAGTAPAASADSTRDRQWSLDAFEAEKRVWPESEGEGVTVAVVDDGVDASHPDLRDNVLPGANVVGGGPGNVATQDHGTAMASLIAGHGHGPGNGDGIRGLAPKAKILPAKVDRPDGKVDTDTVADGINYAVEQKVDVINISLAGMWSHAKVKKAVALAWENDVLVVAGAGNKGLKGIDMPAGLPGVVAVGAITEAGNVWENSNHGEELMLTAPGADIEAATLDSGYESSNGTSNATAYVSAAAALVRAKYPDLTAGQVVNRLTKTALLPEKMGEAPDDHYGYGMIRPYRALTEDIPAGPKNGPLTAPKGAGEPGSKDTGGTGEEQEKAADEIRNGSDDSMGRSQSWALIGLGAVGVLVVVVLAIALVLRGRRRNGPPGAGGVPPGGHYPNQPPPHAPAHFPQGPGGPPPGPPPGGPGGY